MEIPAGKFGGTRQSGVRPGAWPIHIKANSHRRQCFGFITRLERNSAPSAESLYTGRFFFYPIYGCGLPLNLSNVARKKLSGSQSPLFLDLVSSQGAAEIRIPCGTQCLTVQPDLAGGVANFSSDTTILKSNFLVP